MAATKKEARNASKIIPFDAAHGKLYNSLRERDENVIGQQIQAAREAHGLSITALTERLSQYGITAQRSSISRWETGETVPNAYQLLAVCHALNIEDGINYFTREPKREPVLNNEGLGKLAEYKELLILSGKYKPTPLPTKGKIKYITKKVSMLPVSAGTGEFLSDDSFEEVSFPASAVPEEADFGIRVSGDSMEPVYHDGQTVWVQQCECLYPGEVGIFEYDGNGYLKLYDEQEPDENNQEYFLTSDGTLRMQPVLVSYNEKYKPIVVSPHTFFRVAGRVLN